MRIWSKVGLTLLPKQLRLDPPQKPSISISIIPNASIIPYGLRSLPSDVFYDTYTELFNTINRHIEREGYIIIKVRSKTNSKGIYRVDFAYA